MRLAVNPRAALPAAFAADCILIANRCAGVCTVRPGVRQSGVHFACRCTSAVGVRSPEDKGARPPQERPFLRECLGTFYGGPGGRALVLAGSFVPVLRILPWAATPVSKSGVVVVN